MSDRPDPAEVVAGYEPYEVDLTGASGVSKSIVEDIVQSIAGPEPYQEGTRAMKTHSAVVNLHLSPTVDLDTVADVVRACDRLNLMVYAKEDGRFSSGWNLRTLSVSRKRFTEDYYPERSPWWDAAGMDPEVDSDE